MSGDRVYVGHPGTTVEARFVSLPKAVDGAIKRANAMKRRGRRDYRHYVRPIRHDGRIVAWAVLKRVAR